MTSLTSSAAIFPPPPHFTHTAPATLVSVPFLIHTRAIPISGPLYLLFSLPGMPPPHPLPHPQDMHGLLHFFLQGFTKNPSFQCLKL